MVAKSKGKPKNKLLNFFGWFFGVIFIIGASTLILSAPLTSLFYGLAGLLLIPIFGDLLDRLGIKIHGLEKAGLLILLLFLGNVLTPPSTDSDALANKEENPLIKTPKEIREESYFSTLSENDVSVSRVQLNSTNVEEFAKAEGITLQHPENAGLVFVSIVYIYKEKAFVDEYLGLMFDSAKIYKALFANHLNIQEIWIAVLKQEKDAYGNTETKILGKTNMGRATANKINWKEFDSSRLDEVTTVEFSGESVYKSLEDLQKDLEVWNSYYDNYPYS